MLADTLVVGLILGWLSLLRTLVVTLFYNKNKKINYYPIIKRITYLSVMTIGIQYERPYHVGVLVTTIELIIFFHKYFGMIVSISIAMGKVIEMTING